MGLDGELGHPATRQARRRRRPPMATRRISPVSASACERSTRMVLVAGGLRHAVRRSNRATPDPRSRTLRTHEGVNDHQAAGTGLPARMRAIVQRSFGGPEVPQLSEVDRPALDHSQVLVRVHAAGVNPTTARPAPANYRPRPGDAAAHDRPRRLGGRAGRRPGPVPARRRSLRPARGARGGLRRVCRRPIALPGLQAEGSVAGAGGRPAACRAHGLAMLTETACVHVGQWVLIHAAAGGVGHLAVQIAKGLGAHVPAIARADKHDLLRPSASMNRSTTRPGTSPKRPTRWTWW